MQKLAINKVKNWRVWWPLARVVPSSFLTKGRIFLLREMPKKSICAEIGTYNGKFAKKILYFTNPQQLHLIDPWEGSWYDKAPSQNKMNERYQHVLKRFAREINRGQVAINRGYSHEVHNNFEDNYFDWIYIDGNHQYEFVKQDLELYYPKIKMGGFITGDDYAEGEGHWWQEGGGVKKAIDEFITTKPLQVIKIKNRQFLLRKVGGT